MLFVFRGVSVWSGVWAGLRTVGGLGGEGQARKVKKMAS